MTDEVKAAAERIANHECHISIYADAQLVAKAYLAHIDCEAEHAKPIDREWLESIGFSETLYYEIDEYFMLDWAHGSQAIHAEGHFSIYRLPLPHITTRGQVLDLLRVLGKEVKL